MARKGKQQKRIGKTESAQIAKLKKIQQHVGRTDLITACKLAEEFTRLYPKNPQGWELLADIQAQQQDLASACFCMEQAISIAPGEQPQAELKLSQYELFAGKVHQAIERLKRLSSKIPSDKRVWAWLSRAYHVIGESQEALAANDKAFSLDHSDPETLLWRSRIFDQLKRHSEAYQTARALKKISPNTIGVSNHLASLSLREGDYIAAEEHFNDELAISDNAATAYNALIGKHYNPEYTAQALTAFAVAWQANYIDDKNITRAVTVAKSNKKIRIGLLSNSFRTHPVGQMILPVLEAIDKHELELFFYSTSQTADHLTDAIKATADKWTNISEASDEQLNQIIRQDRIDILIDMNGGGEGSRFTALSQEPAPLMVKWVGMLINTTGLKCFDYLLSDSIETPKGVDHLYTEKLIRLPDDYVCYHVPKYIPEVNGLPALKNGFITFGCLNNPAKLSDPLIKEWSILLNEVPGSKLLLRGIQFESDAFCQKIFARFAQYGIDNERLILEGPAKHQEFLKTYQRIDIALDTWPYSGGLTTCEALAMGVPVVTCVGPAFAGRHSATHLANAGLPELVTDNWADFRRRVQELIVDLPNLAVIRAALRTILKESPVCDGVRFAKHFTKAMRAIWQRHCEGKASEALTFNKEGDAWFADEVEPVALVEVDSSPEPHQEASFVWDLDSPVMVMDNGARFARHPRFAEWMQTGNFAVITFDPGSLLTKQAAELKQLGEWHHYPHATLGNGEDTTLYATLDPELTGTLEPLNLHTAEALNDPARVLSTLPISTVPLDAIEGIPSIDLLFLDSLNDNLKTLSSGAGSLKNTLVIIIEGERRLEQAAHMIAEDVEQWANDNGFLFSYVKSLSSENNEDAKGFFVLLNNSPDVLRSSKKVEKALFIIEKLFETDLKELLFVGGREKLFDVDVMSNLMIAIKNLDSSHAQDIYEELKKKLNGKTVVFLGSGDMANYGVIESAIQTRFERFQSKGVPCEILYASDKNFYPELIKRLERGRDVFVGGNRFYDASISISGLGNKNIFDEFNVPLIANIGDHPFARFMLPRVRDAGRSTLLTGCPSLAEEMGFLRPDLPRITANVKKEWPGVNRETDLSHVKRGVDILIPMNLAYACRAVEIEASLLYRAKERGERYKRLAKNVLNGYHDFSSSLFNCFCDEYESVFKEKWRVSLPWSNDDVFLMTLLSDIDDVIRGKERLFALKRIIDLTSESQKIVVLQGDNIKDILLEKGVDFGRRNVSFIGTQHASNMPDLYKNSRFVLNVNPTYHDNIHERVLHACMYGCALISNKNCAMEELMQHGKDVLFYDEKDIISQDYFEKNASYEIAQRALRIIECSFNKEVGDGLVELMIEYLE